MNGRVIVIGAGLAGCEAAYRLANRGIGVTLIEQKPLAFSRAHRSDCFAELVCSNSLKAERIATSAGLLKAEMRMLDSLLLRAADRCRVPAGGALAVDRDAFSNFVTDAIRGHEGIEVISRVVDGLDDFTSQPVLVATGPLTGGGLDDSLSALCGAGMLYFHDAAAPVITASSIDHGRVAMASRYGRGTADYLNCFMDRQEYLAFQEQLAMALAAPLHEADDTRLYQGCMPIESLAKKGIDTMRFGPLKPVGLIDPVTGRRPWAAVQLRRENAEGTLYNLVGFQTGLRFGEQKRVFSMIPGLESAEFVRYGVMHRNTYVNSPAVLTADLRLKASPGIWLGGQITGVEGYMESAACGLLAAISMECAQEGRDFIPPPDETMTGSLLRYITTENQNFQPMGASMGLLPPMDREIRGKDERYEALASRALSRMEAYACELS